MSLQTYKQHIAYISASVVLAVFSAGSIIKFTDPEKTGPITFIFLYASIFLSVVGIATLAGLGLRQLFVAGIYIVNLANSFRQALLVGLLVLSLLLLSSLGLLYWWVVASMIILLACIEAFFSLKL